MANLISSSCNRKNSPKGDIYSKQLSCKKDAALCKMANMKKSCEIQVATKKWL